MCANSLCTTHHGNKEQRNEELPFEICTAFYNLSSTYRSSSLQARVTSGKVVQFASQPFGSFLSHPHSIGEESSGAGIITWAQQ